MPSKFSKMRGQSLVGRHSSIHNVSQKHVTKLFSIFSSNVDRFLPCDALRCTVFVIVILSVRPSVRPSATLVDCVHIVWPTIMTSSPYGSLIMLVSGDITFILKFEEGHSEQGRWMRVGWVRIGDFRPISRRLSETVRDTTKVTINH